MRPCEVTWRRPRGYHSLLCSHWRRTAIAATLVSTLPQFPSGWTTKPRLAAACNQLSRAPLDQHPLPRAIVSTPRRPPRFCRLRRVEGLRNCTGRGEPYDPVDLSCQLDISREPLGSSSGVRLDVAIFGGVVKSVLVLVINHNDSGHCGKPRDVTLEYRAACGRRVKKAARALPASGM